MAEDYPFRPCRIQHTLCRIQEGAGPRQRRTVVPGQPLRRRLIQFFRVGLRLVRTVERIGAIQLAGVDQAHEKIADTGSISSLVKQRVLAMQDGFLQCPLTNIVIKWCPWLSQKQSKSLPVLE